MRRNSLLSLTSRPLLFFRLPRHSLFGVIMLIILPYSLEAEPAPPSPFTAEYEAQYGGFKAKAERSLEISDSGQVEMNTQLRLKLLGKTLSTIKEQSILDPDALTGELKPAAYSFIQTGLGKRSRYISFDWENGQANADIGSDRFEIPLEFAVADNLSTYLELRNHLMAGEKDIIFPAIDKGELEQYHFKVIGEEDVKTSLGLLRTVKVERVREPGSNRSTIIWLALDWDYLLVKLEQQEKDSRGIRLELKNASVKGDSVTGKNQETL